MRFYLNKISIFLIEQKIFFIVIFNIEFQNCQKVSALAFILKRFSKIKSLPILDTNSVIKTLMIQITEFYFENYL